MIRSACSVQLMGRPLLHYLLIPTEHHASLFTSSSTNLLHVPSLPQPWTSFLAFLFTSYPAAPSSGFFSQYTFTSLLHTSSSFSFSHFVSEPSPVHVQSLYRSHPLSSLSSSLLTSFINLNMTLNHLDYLCALSHLCSCTSSCSYRFLFPPSRVRTSVSARFSLLPTFLSQVTMQTLWSMEIHKVSHRVTESRVI